MSQPYDRVFNFSAGPCTLEVEVLEEARDGIMNWNGAGMSVMEMSHRSPAFEGILADTEQSLRQLLGVPDNYKILFLQGGASMQFSMIPMTFLRDGTADYITTGTWGKKAEEAGCMVGNVNLLFSGKSTNFDRVPDWNSLRFTDNANYVYFTSNETIQGVEFKLDPEVPGDNLICDMSSNILSRPLDLSKYAVVYAGAQKNMGPAGVCVVIMRDDFIERVPAGMAPMLDYRLHAENDSMYNTPPCWCIYMCGLTYKWLARNGGLEAAGQRNERKAKLVYDAIDASGGFYKGHAQQDCRSLMNVTFTLPDDELTKQFVSEAESLKLDGLKGHRSVGGIRASIYNAFPEEGCRVLAGFMADFARRKG